MGRGPHAGHARFRYRATDVSGTKLGLVWKSMLPYRFRNAIFSSRLWVTTKFQRILEEVGCVTRSADFQGTYTGQEIEAVVRRLKALDLNDQVHVIDVGCNNGAWFCELRNSPWITVAQGLLVEPIPDFYALARETFKSDESVRVLNSAVGEVLEMRQTSIARIANGGRRHKIPAGEDETPDLEMFEVALCSGDEIVRNFEFPVTFLKVDCDGDDFSVLRSFETTISIRRPVVLFEHSSQFARSAGYRLGHVLSWFNKLNYHVEVVQRDGGLARIKTHRFEVGLYQTKNFLAVPY